MGVTGGVSIYGLDGIPEVEPGADLAALIGASVDASGLGLHDRDVLVVTHKVVAKAEGRLIDLRDIEPSPLANHFGDEFGKDPRQVEVVLRETRHGFVCANAGVDASNVPGEGIVCLLPEDPDATARRLRDAFAERRGVDVAVIISDTFGRAWRNGIINVAIGVAGMDPFADYRGQPDPYGYMMVATRMAIADELASAAELVMGKMDMRPVALIRGYEYRPPQPGSESGRDLLMDPERDLFR